MDVDFSKVKNMDMGSATKPTYEGNQTVKSAPKSEPDFTYNEFEIRKKNGKVRKICNPRPDLKRWQRVILPKIVEVFHKLLGNRGLDNTFHGFIPKRNAVTAATEHIKFDATLMFDITDFFDSVTKEHVEKVTPLKTLCQQKYVDRLFHKDGYPAQGFPTSPMVANIALIPVMEAIQRRLAERFGEGNFAFTCYADDLQISLKENTRKTDSE